MTLKSDLTSEVRTVFGTVWSKRNGNVVPDDASVSLGNVGVNIDATVLYADLDGSTQLVDTSVGEFAAEIYKTYLHCTAKIIRNEGGSITAYDGDRIMAVYIGNSKNTDAVRTALKINYAVKNIINPAIANQYPQYSYRVRQIVGIDASALLVAKTGVRGANDLVWVGRAANHAAKLSELSDGDNATWISKSIYDNMHVSVMNASNGIGANMWTARTWTQMNDQTVYCSNYWWPFD